jgi:protein gp37
MAKRLQAMGQSNYANGFELTLQEQAIQLPLHWKKPQVIFVNSMSDLFHEDIPVEFILRVFDVMKRADWHQFQILTKRSERLLEFDSFLSWVPHIWMGVSVENQDYTFRIDHLRGTGANIKFLSLEPLLGPMHNLNLRGIDWVIVGGESGPGARPMDPSWVIETREHCRKANVPFFFKQWGGFNKKKAGRELEGKTWDEMPVILQKPKSRTDSILSTVSTIYSAMP